MNIFRYFLVVVTGIFSYTSVQAGNNGSFNVLACEPEWAALVYALGDESFRIDSATTFQQDPHHIQARPSLIAKARNADLLVCSGAELEIGWLPVLLRKSANPRIQPGAAGSFMATEYAALLNRRSSVDRSEGGVHAAGNPHLHLDPGRMVQIAQALSQSLIKQLPDKRAIIEQNLHQFVADINRTTEQLQPSLADIKDKHIVVHHDDWVYLFDWLGISKTGNLEPKPGLPPTTSHLTSLLSTVNQHSTDLIIYSSYQDNKAARWLSNKTGIPTLQLPYSVDQWQKKNALPDFYENTVKQLSQALGQKRQ